MSKHTSFLGIPIEGDISDGREFQDQRPVSELAPLMQALLDDEGIACFGWTQYTPYFNDGETCYFSAHGLWVARPEDLDPEDDDPDSLDTENLDVKWGTHHLGQYTGGRWEPDRDKPGRSKRVGDHYEGPDQARFDRCMALADAITGDAFDHALLELFGDHASIRVTRTGITVDSYEHE